MRPAKVPGEVVVRMVWESLCDVPSCDRLTLDKFEEGLWRGSGSGIRWL